MTARLTDGGAGDVNYGVIGSGYSTYRQPEPSIARLIDHALGGARTVLNVGAGAGSYEPRTRDVTPVEPSAAMRAQRPRDLPEALDARAEALPFADCAFDAAMATFTVHQWADLAAGLSEMRRVTRGPIVILTCDPALVRRFWLNDYAPEVLAAEARRYPALDALALALGEEPEVIPVPAPLHCRDGFNEAYFGRPERFLDAGARLACSAWSFVDAEYARRAVERLAEDLDSGAWDARYGGLRGQAEYDGSLRLVVFGARAGGGRDEGGQAQAATSSARRDRAWK